MVGKGKVPDPDSNTKTPGHLFSFDISSVNVKSLENSKYWVCFVDSATGFTWSFFLTTKGSTPRTMLNLVNLLEGRHKIPVKILRCIGAGETIKTRALFLKEKSQVQFQITSRDTPQHNGQVERKIATIDGKVTAVLNAGGFHDNIRKQS